MSSSDSSDYSDQDVLIIQEVTSQDESASDYDNEVNQLSKFYLDRNEEAATYFSAAVDKIQENIDSQADYLEKRFRKRIHKYLPYTKPADVRKHLSELLADSLS